MELSYSDKIYIDHFTILSMPEALYQHTVYIATSLSSSYFSEIIISERDQSIYGFTNSTGPGTSLAYMYTCRMVSIHYIHIVKCTGMHEHALLHVYVCMALLDVTIKGAQAVLDFHSY